jgi:TPR repeat protein
VSINEAERWARLSSEGGSAIGTITLGSLEMQKNNVLKANQYYQDALQTRELFQLADDKDPIASFCLAELYMYSEPIDPALAVTYYQKAADLNYSNAQATLGTLYVQGKVVPRDTMAGIGLLEEAAEQGSAVAALNLGTSYAIGDGISRDTAIARKWIQKAADQGLATAQLQLGKVLIDEPTKVEDIQTAKKYLKKASDQHLVNEANVAIADAKEIEKTFIEPVQTKEPADFLESDTTSLAVSDIFDASAQTVQKNVSIPHKAQSLPVKDTISQDDPAFDLPPIAELKLPPVKKQGPEPIRVQPQMNLPQTVSHKQQAKASIKIENQIHDHQTASNVIETQSRYSKIEALPPVVEKLPYTHPSPTVEQQVTAKKTPQPSYKEIVQNSNTTRPVVTKAQSNQRDQFVEKQLANISEPETIKLSPERFYALREKMNIPTLQVKGNKGDVVSQIKLGNYYNYIENNMQLAANWYLKASYKGSGEAQRKVGRMYFTGNGLPQDYGIAFRYFLAAAKNGDAVAQRYLGIMYFKGVGLVKDEDKAVRWFNVASNNGDNVAKNFLSING